MNWKLNRGYEQVSTEIIITFKSILSFILFQHLAGGTLLVCQLDVALNGVTLYDSQRSSLSKRNLDADTISYCGLTRYDQQDQLENNLQFYCVHDIK